jgi:hypothetical protein
LPVRGRQAARTRPFHNRNRLRSFPDTLRKFACYRHTQIPQSSGPRISSRYPPRSFPLTFSVRLYCSVSFSFSTGQTTARRRLHVLLGQCSTGRNAGTTHTATETAPTLCPRHCSGHAIKCLYGGFLDGHRLEEHYRVDSLLAWPRSGLRACLDRTDKG